MLGSSVCLQGCQGNQAAPQVAFEDRDFSNQQTNSRTNHLTKRICSPHFRNEAQFAIGGINDLILQSLHGRDRRHVRAMHHATAQHRKCQLHKIFLDVHRILCRSEPVTIPKRLLALHAVRAVRTSRCVRCMSGVRCHVCCA